MEIFCQCGCGKPTSIAKRNFNQEGIKKGEYMKYIRGHHFKGCPKSLEHKLHISQSLSGKPKSTKEAERLRKLRLGIPHTENTLKKIRDNHKSPMLGKIHSEESRKKISEAIKKNGVPWTKNQSYETRLKRSLSMRGEKSYNWKGGKSILNSNYYRSFDYKDWRRRIFERDFFICQYCGKKGGQLQAHHLKPKSEHLELIFDLKNGITLCIQCHKKTDNYGNRLKTKEELLKRFE